MFLDFYHLREEPFGVTPDPRFLYLGSSHREALASLFYGIETDRGFMALVAFPGLGKTTLVYQLLNKLQANSRTILFSQTQCNSRELIQHILSDLDIDISGMETVALHNKLKEILNRENLAGHRFLLVIDEAQNLDDNVLETVRLLSNLETSRTKLLQILLVGQPDLARRLATPALEQLQQRISPIAKLEPFNLEETSSYVAHRLQVAGYTGDDLFTSEALQSLQKHSKGIPRNINRLCFGALSLGWALGRKKIDNEVMREVVSDLDLNLSEPEAVNESIAPRSNPLNLTRVPGENTFTLRPNRLLRNRALGISSFAAFLALLVGWVALHGMAHPLGQGSPTVLPARVHTPPYAQSSVPAASAAPLNAADGTKFYDNTRKIQSDTGRPRSGTPSTSDDEYGTVVVKVRSGETLQGIAIRIVGGADKTVLRLIRKLNPQMTNPNRILANEKIRLPLVSKANNPENETSTNGPSGNN